MTNISIEKLLEIGIALSAEKDGENLLETILTTAMDITNCDGGTIYTKSEAHQTLVFRVMITKSMNVHAGGHKGEIKLPPVQLSRNNVSACAATDRKLINIADVYDCNEYDFSGTKRYDDATGYNSKSMLAIPLEDDHGDIIGVLQLLNAMDEFGNVIPFEKESELVLQSLSSQAAICMANMNYAAEINELLHSLVRVMSTAIDARSPYNAYHTRNMVRNAEGFIEWLEKTGKEWQFNEKEKQQFLMSVWLHDVGKLVIPLEIMDKENRLGTLYGKVTSRFETLLLKIRIAHLEGRLNPEQYEALVNEIHEARKFVDDVNMMGYLRDETVERVRLLGEKEYKEGDEVTKWLAPDEVEALQIRKGTLSPAERDVIESHVRMTRKMLNEIAFTKDFRRVAEISGSHHEYVNGTGYPNKHKGNEVPIEARLLTIVDIYDALTAIRPYKTAMPEDKAVGILDLMVNDGQLDGDILALFKQYLSDVGGL